MEDVTRETVSYSCLSAFKRCSHAYRLAYIDKLRPKRVQKPLYKGTAIHRLLEARIRHLMDPSQPTWQDVLRDEIVPAYESLGESDRQEIGDFPETCRRIMTQYDYYYFDADSQMRYLEVEKWIEMPLVIGKRKADGTRRVMVLVGKVDAIVERPDGQYLVEHKTYSRDPMSLGDTWINMQTSLYAHILNTRYGYHIKGVLWDMVKSEGYSDPNILKSGAYGKQSGKVTLLSFEHASTRPPQETLDEVRDNYVNFISRFTTPLSSKAIAVFMKETKDLARQIYSKGDRILDLRNLSRDCSWCAYHDICQAEMTGGDVDYIKSMLYQGKEDTNVVSGSDQEE